MALKLVRRSRSRGPGSLTPLLMLTTNGVFRFNGTAIHTFNLKSYGHFEWYEDDELPEIGVKLLANATDDSFTISKGLNSVTLYGEMMMKKLKIRPGRYRVRKAGDFLAFNYQQPIED